MRPNLEVGQGAQDETCLNAGHSRQGCLRDMGMLALSEVDQQFEDAHQKEGVVALPNSAISLDKQEEELIEVLKAFMDICQ
jgi:hypothetical protein